MPSPKEEQPAANPPARWWPALAIVAADLLATAWIWRAEDWNHQERNLRIIGTAASALLLLLIWALFFSRFPRRFRIGLASATLALAAMAPLLIRIRGVTGNLIPVLEWRWKHPAFSQAAAAIASEPVSRAATNAPSADVARFPGDFPQFLGPQRDGILPGPPLAEDWDRQPPQIRWRRAVGPAWSGFAVVGRRAVTQEQRGADETIVCYDLMTGNQLWVHSDPAHYQTTIAGEGPRATPAIDRGRVFAMGATGILNCLDLESGRKIWGKNVIDENHGRMNEWGTSCSPLAARGTVFVSVAGRADCLLAAYDAATGARLWTAGQDLASYSSPQPMRIGGIDQIVVFAEHGPEAHALESGAFLWRSAWPGGQPQVSQPILAPGGDVLISSGYGRGAALLHIDVSGGKCRATRLWKTLRLKSKFADLILKGEFIYGLDDGILACLNLDDGRRRWKDGRYGHGQLLLAGDLLLVTAEDGELVLIDPRPDGLHERARFRLFHSKTWNPPALAGNWLLARTDQQAAAVQLPTRGRSLAPR